MLKNLKVLIVFLFSWQGLLWVENVSGQSYSGESFPKEFKYQNKPIDAYCIEKLTVDDNARATSVNIDDCSKHPDHQISNVNEDLSRKGFMGYDYTVSLPNTTTALKGITYYRYLGKLDNGHLVYSMQNNGGSGFITAILLIERQGNALRLIKEIAGGDRCNSGIDANVEFKNKILRYKTSVTPYDVIYLSGSIDKNIEAYEDLAACAACCVGEAVFEYDLSTDSAKPKLISFTFGKDAGRDDVYTQGKLQSCFNEVVRQYLSKNKNSKLSNDQLSDFATQFTSSCVK